MVFVKFVFCKMKTALEEKFLNCTKLFPNNDIIQCCTSKRGCSKCKRENFNFMLKSFIRLLIVLPF